LIAAMPFSVISSLEEINVDGKNIRGRKYIWGVAEGN
jgi:septin family protein